MIISISNIQKLMFKSPNNNSRLNLKACIIVVKQKALEIRVPGRDMQKQ